MSSAPNRVTDLMNSIPSYNDNMLLAAFICLILVIVFVFILHIYAKWFLLSQAHHHSISVGLSSFNSLTKGTGLDPSLISTIPCFVYKPEEIKQSMECVICLSAFEDNQVGRVLSKCEHSFHVECIDTWLRSHSNCPICRAPAVFRDNNINAFDVISVENSDLSMDGSCS
ncbi:hypothetical protein ACFE04_015615 [Oxalis oulophora]